MPEEQRLREAPVPDDWDAIIIGGGFAGISAAIYLGRAMRRTLERWMKETSDPLLEGPVPAPAGTEFNLPNQVSADEPTVKGPADPEQALAATRGPTGAPST